MIDINNIVLLFECVLAERKIVLYSRTYEALTPAAEALRMIMFPLEWEFPCMCDV